MGWILVVSVTALITDWYYILATILINTNHLRPVVVVIDYGVSAAVFWYFIGQIKKCMCKFRWYDTCNLIQTERRSVTVGY